MLRQAFTYFLFLIYFTGICQKYNFVNWTVEDGLIQSQCGYICQDRYRQLWIATEGGISKFDGRKFTGYAAQEGLISNDVNSLLCDKAGNIWAGTNYGISVFNGKTFKTIKLSNSTVNNVTAMIQVNDESIYALNNNLLFRLNNLKSQYVKVTSAPTETINTIYKTNNDRLLAYVAEKGIYIFSLYL